MISFYVVSIILISVMAETQTIRKGNLNQQCSNKSDCGIFGYICTRNGTCKCDRFYFSNEIDAKCLAGLNQPCRYDEHCVEGAYCEVQRSCKCKEDFYPSEDGLTCSSSGKIVDSPYIYIILIVYNILECIGSSKELN